MRSGLQNCVNILELRQHTTTRYYTSFAPSCAWSPRRRIHIRINAAGNSGKGPGPSSNHSTPPLKRYIPLLTLLTSLHLAKDECNSRWAGKFSVVIFPDLRRFGWSLAWTTSMCWIHDLQASDLHERARGNFQGPGEDCLEPVHRSQGLSARHSIPGKER